jgi:threonyl-tRNA synthetase
MTDLERIRHSAAHVLATAILKIWPEAQFAAGPPVETGFYYDVDLPHRISPRGLRADRGRDEEGDQGQPPLRAHRRHARTRPSSSARADASARSDPSARARAKFKLGHPPTIPEGEEISYLQKRRFHRSLRRPARHAHRQHRRLQAHHVASAYYKGDEKNPQLQRIYGTAFKNKTEMEAYFTMLEEAKKRDHRKLGQRNSNLFAFDDRIRRAPACPSGCPNGTVLVEELEKLAKETEFAGRLRARPQTPHLAREKMYTWTSEHLPYTRRLHVPGDQTDLTPGERLQMTDAELKRAINLYDDY